MNPTEFCSSFAPGCDPSRSTRWIRRPAPPPPLHPIPHTGGHHPTTSVLHHTTLESVLALGQACPVAAHGQLAPTAPSCRRTSRRDEPAFPYSGCRPTGYSSSAAYVERRVAQVVSALQTTGMEAAVRRAGNSGADGSVRSISLCQFSKFSF